VVLLSCRSDESVVKLGIRRITVVSFTYLRHLLPCVQGPGGGRFLGKRV